MAPDSALPQFVPSVPCAEELLRALRDALFRCCPPPQKPTLLFSGGLDSSLLAWMLRDRAPELVTIGLPGSKDLVAAEEAAELLGLGGRRIALERARLIESWRDCAARLATEPEPRRSVLFGLGCAFQEVEGSSVLVGQGADELFGGYDRYARLDPAGSEEQSLRDLGVLRARDWPETLELARRWRVVPNAPYLDSEFVRRVTALPAGDRFGGSERKPLLRAMARHAGLPEELAARPKKALQYGTGIARAVRELSPS